MGQNTMAISPCRVLEFSNTNDFNAQCTGHFGGFSQRVEFHSIWKIKATVNEKN